MSNTTKTAEGTVSSAVEIKKNVEAHKTAANHLEAAAKCHSDAAKHHEAGNHEKAEKSALEAKEHHKHATEALKNDHKIEKVQESHK